MAGLIGRRPVDFLAGLAGAAGFAGADLPPHFAQRFFIAAEMRLRAAVLILRLAGAAAANFALGGAGCAACFALGGRPRRAGWEPSPTRAEIAWLSRLRSAVSSESI